MARLAAGLPVTALTTYMNSLQPVVCTVSVHSTLSERAENARSASDSSFFSSLTGMLAHEAGNSMLSLSSDDLLSSFIPGEFCGDGCGNRECACVGDMWCDKVVCLVGEGSEWW